MNEFIEQATERLGISETAARSMAGGLFGMIKQQAPAEDFVVLAQAIPGVTQIMRAPGSIGGSRLGRMADQIIHALAGEKPDAESGLGDLLRESGLSVRQARTFSTMFVAFIRTRTQPELASRLLTRVPVLQSLVG